jgi:hypothetical protein
MSDNNEKVGYKNPPKSTRFKPGQSGNPKGRPKGCKVVKPESVGEALKAEMEGEMIAKQNGKKRKISNLQAWMRKLFIDSMNGDKTSTRMLKDLMIKYPIENFIGMKTKLDLGKVKPFDPNMSAEDAQKSYNEFKKLADKMMKPGL